VSTNSISLFYPDSALDKVYKNIGLTDVFPSTFKFSSTWKYCLKVFEVDLRDKQKVTVII